MCLTLNRRLFTSLDAELAKSSSCTAHRDIEVFKKLVVKKTPKGKVYYSPFRTYKYKKGEHYYQDGIPFTFRITGSGNNLSLEIHEGLHSYVNAYFAGCGEGYEVVKMIVPKGSKFFLGINGDVVSDNLIWK